MVTQIGIIDPRGEFDVHLVADTVAAINIQVARDVARFWNVQAHVRHMRNVRKAPAGVCPVWLVARLAPGERDGFHRDNRHQPYARVMANPADVDYWTRTVSHEIIEMLVDPFGNRMCHSTSIKLNGGKIVNGPGKFDYVVEACDPCEAKAYAYRIHGIAVSDFVTPQYYEPVGTRGARYSFKDAIPAPRRVLPGGYITWLNPQTGGWHQCHHHWGAPRPTINNLPRPTGDSVREWVDVAVRNSRAGHL